jgi:formiminotetrahydrofolate cyclodeaminase
MLVDLSVRELLDKTASGEPLPGGGSMSAMTAAAAAALVQMVAGLTVGRQKFASVEEEMTRVAQSAADLRADLTADVERDAEAYNQVLQAFRSPKETDTQKAARRLAIQAGYKAAAAVPLQVAERALQVMQAAEQAVSLGNPNAVTDGIVGVLLARSAALGALYNVRINLAAITDAAWVAQQRGKVEHLEREVKATERRILDRVTLDP